MHFQFRKHLPSPTPSAISSGSSQSNNSKKPNVSVDSAHQKFGKFSFPRVVNHLQSGDGNLKLGSGSPQAVRKLLALSEMSRSKSKISTSSDHRHSHLLHSASPILAPRNIKISVRDP